MSRWNADEVPHGSVPDLAALLRSAFRPVEDFQKVLAAMEERWKLDIGKIEALGKEREVLREENELLRGKIASLEEEKRKAEARERDEVEMLKEENERLRVKVAGLEGEMRKGGARKRGEVEMSKEENVGLRSNEERVREVEDRYPGLSERMSEIEKAIEVPRDEEGMKDAGGEKGAPGEASTFNVENEDEDGGGGGGVGDGIGAGEGNDSWDGGRVSSFRKARKMLDFGEGACASASASTSAGSSGKSLVKEAGVSQGDGKTQLKEVELVIIDDDVAGSGHLSRNYLSCQRPTVGMHPGKSNQEREKRELKRKRGLHLNLIEGENYYNHASVAGISWTQANGEKLNQNVGSGIAKPGNGSCLHGGAWKDAEELRVDLERDNELCMKAVCALYRQQNLARKAMERSTCQGFSGLRVLRGNFLGEFLTDRDPQCKLKRSVKDVQEYCPRGLSDCRNIAIEHSNQLFAMYQRKEDPHFPTEGSDILFSGGSSG